MRAQVGGVILALISGAGLVSSAGGPSIRFQGSPGVEEFGTVAVAGLPPAAVARLEDGWPDLFSVVVATDAKEELPAVLGRYVVDGGTVRFVPRFPFTAGMSYRARFEGPEFDSRSGHRGTPALELRFTMPEPAGGPATVVKAIYPSAETVPSNLLRLYVHFSAPIRARDVARHVHLYDASGAEVELPFVDVDAGLWDPSRTRLTLFFHPGRIKRGVAPREAMGPVLREGETYRFVVDRELLDDTGEPLAADHEHPLIVSAADRRSPDVGDWRVIPPASPEEELIVDLPEPLDHALLRRLVHVEDADGAVVPGATTVSRGETRWTLAPRGAWSAGEYRIVINRAIEDLAGNTLDHLFEEKSGSAPAGAVRPGDPVAIPFRVE